VHSHRHPRTSLELFSCPLVQKNSCPTCRFELTRETVAAGSKDLPPPSAAHVCMENLVEIPEDEVKAQLRWLGVPFDEEATKPELVPILLHYLTVHIEKEMVVGRSQEGGAEGEAKSTLDDGDCLLKGEDEAKGCESPAAVRKGEEDPGEESDGESNIFLTEVIAS
jgi:hypothetical protein